MREDSRYFLYKMRKGQFLSQVMKGTREAFKQTQTSSSNEHTLLAYSVPTNVLIVMKNKHPAHILVFGVVTSDDDLMLPFNFSHGLTINTEAYIKFLEEVVLAWIERVAARRLYIWQQDSASCHTSRTQSWLWEKFCNLITSNTWLPNSPNCNYSVWVSYEREINKSPCNTKNELKAKIRAAFISLNKETVEKAYKRLRSRREISLNKFNLWYFKIFTCDFGKYIW